MISHLFEYIRGPRLFHIDNIPYLHNFLESVPELYLKVFSVFKCIMKWTFPFWLTMVCKRAYNREVKFTTVSYIFSGFGIIYVMAILVRGIGRACNPSYRFFVEVLLGAQADYSAENKAKLAKFDTDFWALPVDFDLSKAGIVDDRKPIPVPQYDNKKESKLQSVLHFPLDIFGWGVVHTIGIRMTFPGVLFSSLLRSQLYEKREELISQYGVERVKILTAGKLEIEALFADRRNSGEENANILVVCSEGNAGFPEVGCPLLPLRVGYSVIGWNHPGFAGSTGLPYPADEQDAMESVMQFALQRLRFRQENILLYGWSIGGYTISWASMNYPQVRGVILDATFDNNVELSMKAMPSIFQTFINRWVRKYLNLDVSSSLCRYPGPIVLIRRTLDEIIQTEKVVSSNRGNFLLQDLLNYRYPSLFTKESVKMMEFYLSMETNSERESVMVETSVNPEHCCLLLKKYISENGQMVFPSRFGRDLSGPKKTQLLLFLISKYLRNFEAQHCAPLQQRYFYEPWSEQSEACGDGSASESSQDWERV